MAKRLLVLAVLLTVASFVSQEAARVAPSPAAGRTTGSRLADAALGGVAIALSPLGAMAGCGGGGPRTSSATAVALSEAVLTVGAGDGPAVGASGRPAVSQLAVADRRPLTGLVVSLRLSRSEPGEMRVALRNPAGAEAVLHEGRSSGLVASFDADTHAGLRDLMTTSAEGTWSLTAATPAGQATIETWSLRLRVRE
jgi:subtilisin-like proprotein convertase family protein